MAWQSVVCPNLLQGCKHVNVQSMRGPAGPVGRGSRAGKAGQDWLVGSVCQRLKDLGQPKWR